MIRRIILILKAETFRSFIMQKRYLLNSLFFIIALYLIFCGIYFAAKHLTSGSASTTGVFFRSLSGYLIWFFAVSILGNFGISLSEEAEIGTLEQIYLSTKEVLIIFTVRCIVNFFITFIQALFLLVFICITYRVAFEFSYNLCVPFLLLAIGVYGFGLIIGGFTIRYKRAGPMVGIIQILSFLLSFLPLSKHSIIIALFIPITKGTEVINHLLSKTPDYLNNYNTHLLILFCHAVLYLMMGIIIFKCFEKSAKKKGNLGHY